MKIEITRSSAKRKNRKRIGVKTSNLILIILAIFLLLFTAGMIAVFIYKDSVPDTLITCVFAACTGELSVLGWIKSTKTKYQKGENEDEEQTDEP